MDLPLATYRLQFTKDFGFEHCRAMLGYLRKLGVSHVYASPIFKARPGSTHGYDICDHNVINPELGGLDGFRKTRDEAKALGIGWVQDIVPNHMAVSGDNPLLADVLENGQHSRYSSFFDIDWEHPDPTIRGRMLAPFLGTILSECLSNGEIRLEYGQDGFWIAYYALRLPVRLSTYGVILVHGLEKFDAGQESPDPQATKLHGVLNSIAALDAAEPVERRYEQIAFIKQLLWELAGPGAPLSCHLERIVAEYNRPDSGLLRELLLQQHFRLAYWKVAGEEINYRRFFSINELISLRVEEPAVFEATHRLAAEMVGGGDFTGLRVDHIDGLYEPGDYLERLASKCPGVYTLVEKILGLGEPLPEWPIQGTTGYEFMNMVCSLFVRGESGQAMTRTYRRFSGLRGTFPALVREKKELIIRRHMTGDVDNLARLVKAASGMDLRGSDIAFHSLRRAIAQVLSAFPVYRTYITPDSIRDEDRQFIEQAVKTAESEQPELRMELGFLRRFLQLDFDETLTEEERRACVRLAMRFQQFTGPLMAKGYEDTALYVMCRLLCLNEVGGWPDRFGLDDAHWERFCADRARHWPHALSATATHDTKRGEDARMRLAALSELPEQWAEALTRLSRQFARGKDRVGTVRAPDRNDEYFLYQTLLASWPCSPDEPGEMDAFRARLGEYMVKAVREAKVHTGWLKPDEDYERAVLAFAGRFLDRRGDPRVVEAFQPLQRRTAFLGMLYSLGQTLLKIVAPGVPDFYQGTELWDLSFVDPDNRRSVDYGQRSAMLDELSAAFEADPLALAGDLLTGPEDGRIKLFVIWRALQARQTYREVFERGGCAHLRFAGEHSSSLIGMIRERGGAAAMAVVPRYANRLCGEREFPLGKAWGDTRGELPEEAAGEYVDAFTGRKVRIEGRFAVGEVLDRFPVGLLVRGGS
jgi:(1->4)-alpha-D-glucan 1-alpha-D-glucosylmutase